LGLLGIPSKSANKSTPALSFARIPFLNEDLAMDIGHRLRVLRDEKNLSQNDMEKRTGLLRGYISRVENGRTTPSIETLNKMSHALDVPLYQVLDDCQEPPASLNGHSSRSNEWGSAGKDARFLNRLSRLLATISEADRQLLLSLAENITRKQKRTAPKS
jgi:transcriptional regulator with XRE-family HTH domain